MTATRTNRTTHSANGHHHAAVAAPTPTHDPVADVLAKCQSAEQAALASVQAARYALALAEAKLRQVRSENPLRIRVAELAAELAATTAALEAVLASPCEGTGVEGEGSRVEGSAVEGRGSDVATPTPATIEGGTVTDEDGETRTVSADAVRAVLSVLGKRRKGILSPLDGADAVAVLTALDGVSGTAGNTFTLATGRRTIRFTVEAKGLRFGPA